MRRNYTRISDISSLDPVFVRGADHLGIRYVEEFLSIWQVADLQKVVCLSVNRDWDEVDRVSKDLFFTLMPENRELLVPIPQEVLSARCFGALGVLAPDEGAGNTWDKPSDFSIENIGASEVNLIRHLRPIKDQGRRGTCVAFAGIALREFFKDRSVLSEQFLYWACKEIDGIPDVEGTWPRFALKVLQETGTCEGEDWPYNPEPGRTRGQGPPPEDAVEKAARYKIIRELRYGPGAVNDIRERLVGGEGRPVVIAIPVFLSWYANPLTHRTGEIRDPLPGERPIGGHAMLVVGMNDHRRRFYLRNSWGTSWAAESSLGAGYGTISYEYIAKCAQESFSAEAKKEGKIFYFLREEWRTQRWMNAAMVVVAMAVLVLFLLNQYLPHSAGKGMGGRQEHVPVGMHAHQHSRSLNEMDGANKFPSKVSSSGLVNRQSDFQSLVPRQNASGRSVDVTENDPSEAAMLNLHLSRIIRLLERANNILDGILKKGNPQE